MTSVTVTNKQNWVLAFTIQCSYSLNEFISQITKGGPRHVVARPL